MYIRYSFIHSFWRLI